VTTRRRSTIVILIVGLGTISIWATCVQRTARSQNRDNIKALEARVNNTIRERGSIESSRSIDVRCEVEGGSTIRTVVPEGTRVSKGDLLVELDDTALREELAAARIALRQATVALEGASAERKAVELDQTAVGQALEDDVRNTELARERMLGDGGELACQLATVQSELAIARERLKTAVSHLSGTSGERNGKSESELRLMAFEAREAIKIAELRKKFLETHERQYQTAFLNGAIAQKKLQLVRQKNALEKSVRTAKAEVEVKKSAVAVATRKLDQIERQIARCKIYAPQDGIVAYATATASRSSRTTAIEVGATVRERQLLLRIPDLSSLQVRVRVNESRISRVRVGQSARILCDALPQRPLQGRVVQVNDVPEPTSWASGDVKEYAAVVSIEGPVESLRIGMTALVEIAANGDAP
jgi:HlyD family secretion protein